VTRYLIFLAFILAGSCAFAQSSKFIPQKGFVPDAGTAVAIARAVLIPVYGASTIRDEEPLVAARHGDVWSVDGTLQCGHPKVKVVCLGGTAPVEISARDGTILSVIHTK
jgi:NTF2 fold immunity protein